MCGGVGGLYGRVYGASPRLMVEANSLQVKGWRELVMTSTMEGAQASWQNYHPPTSWRSSASNVWNKVVSVRRSSEWVRWLGGVVEVELFLTTYRLVRSRLGPYD